nr:aminopeptidase [Clostridium sp.]
VPGEETSFTIIAFPLPDIGEKFEEIFRETIRINTLDNDLYREIQQKIIDTLDRGCCAEIRGRNGNRTNLRVALAPLRDATKESRFENCVADVNIPVGEVFTSPQLAGTEGLLHVQQVYINGFQFRDLEIRFENGRTVSYTCGNYESGEENRKLVKQVILANHDVLPMGEFAVGTNTTAYAAAQKYGIQDKFPILIAEKTGPHFAVGDTCYSWMEDVPVHNPDGREMIAKENEISCLRKTDPGKAYFNCHTDITIPYSELDTVEAVAEDGERTAIIAGGRFVLPGTEALNESLDRQG